MTKHHAKTLSLFELTQMFPKEEDAIRYLEELRWGSEPFCTKCGSTEKITKQAKHLGRYWCGACRGYFTARTGTPMEYGKVDARKWIFTAYLLMTARKGISSLQLSKEISVSQPTSWYMLHRLRVACGEQMQAIPLSGEVEIDEAYFGGLERNKHESKKRKQGRGKVGKQIVLGMRSRNGKVKAMVMNGADKAAIQPAIKENIEQGATLYTDTYGAYKDIGDEGYTHESVNHSAKEFVRDMAHTNGIESVWAVLKRGFNGVYHHWSMKHCQNYVNEFAFRLNEGNCKRDTQDRLDDLFRSMVGKTITREALTA